MTSARELIICSVILTAIVSVQAVRSSASEVDEAEFLAYVGNLYSMYSQYEEYKIEIEFESLFQVGSHIQNAEEKMVTASVGRRTVSIDGDRKSVQGVYVNRDSLSEARDAYSDEQATRIRVKMVITPSAMYTQYINDWMVASLEKRSVSGKVIYSGYPYHPLERLRQLSETIERLPSEAIITLEEPSKEIVCKIVSTMEYEHPQAGIVTMYSYSLLKFDSIDAKFPNYMESGAFRPDNFENRSMHQIFEIVVCDDSPLGYSEFTRRVVSRHQESGEFIEDSYETVNIKAFEKADPLPEDFRFHLKRGAQFIDYSGYVLEPVVVDIDKETVIEAQ